MNPPLSIGTPAACPPGATAALPVRLIGGLLLGVAVLFAAAGAHADLIAGCCDSLTHLESGDPGYLPWIQDVYGIGEVENQAVGARWSGAGLTALEGYLAAEDPQVVVVLSGTVDAFIGPTWQPGGSPLYDEEQTVGNIVDMVAAILADGATPILVAPPPVYPPCDGSVNPTCLTIEDRLASLARALESEVADPSSAAHGVAFVDLQAVFASYPDPYSLYDDGWNDGLHPDDEGDRVIAQAVLDELGPVVGAPCEDGVDNDGDGYVDFPGDAGCDGPSDWSEGLAVLECEDGVDNDGDGAIDLDDFGCQGQGDFSERTAPDGIACDDGIDNDGDGSIDYPGDAGCGSPVQTEENPGCNDGIDNDGDGLIDFDGGDSLDLDRDGYVDPEFNPAEPEVTAPDPYCRAASLSREEPEEPDEPGKPGCGRGRGWAWGWGRIFHPPWQKECRWRCNAFDQDRVPDWVDWREAPPRWSDRDEDGENWGQSVDGDDDDTGGDSEWSEARGRKRGGGDAAGDSERRGAKGGNRPQRRGR